MDETNSGSPVEPDKISFQNLGLEPSVTKLLKDSGVSLLSYRMLDSAKYQVEGMNVALVTDDWFLEDATQQELFTCIRYGIACQIGSNYDPDLDPLSLLYHCGRIESFAMTVQCRLKGLVELRRNGKKRKKNLPAYVFGEVRNLKKRKST